MAIVDKHTEHYKIGKCASTPRKMKVGKKGSKSKTAKGRKNFTTKKTSKFHVVGGHRVKSLGKPYRHRRK